MQEPNKMMLENVMAQFLPAASNSSTTEAPSYYTAGDICNLNPSPNRDCNEQVYKTLKFSPIENFASEVLIKSFIKSSALKLPKFDPMNLDVLQWYIMCEKLFHINGVHHHSLKLRLILSCFSVDQLNRLGPHFSNNYNNFVLGVFKIFTPCNSRRLHSAMNMQYDGKVLPSVFVYNLKVLLGANLMSETAIRSLFINKIDVNMRRHLSVFEDLPANEFYDKADLYFRNNMRDNSYADLTKSSTLSENESFPLEVICACKQLDCLPSFISENVTLCSKCHSSIDASSPVYSGGNTKQINTKILCYYHSKFGSLARKCRKPCSWNSN